MPIDFYTNSITPRCRAVAMVARHLNIQMNEIYVLPYSDTRKPAFLMINPEHTIPTIVDNGFVLWESRAIMTYLCNKYGSHTDLYPKCPMKRAIVDRLLYFDLNPLCAAAVELHFEYTFQHQPSDTRKVKMNWMMKSLSTLESYLKQSRYVSGDTLTIADISIIPTITLLDVSVNLDFSPFPNIIRWLQTMKAELPYFDEYNTIVIKPFKETVREIQHIQDF